MLESSRSKTLLGGIRRMVAFVWNDIKKIQKMEGKNSSPSVSDARNVFSRGEMDP